MAGVPLYLCGVTSSILDRVRDRLGGLDRVIVAVSGGVDSMVLLDAAASVVDRARLVVATFDHGTGAAARTASALVRTTAQQLGIECVAERASGVLRSEAELRAARWAFLRSVAEARGAVIATAHTEDDQIETVFMRALRDSGARGLAGLYARGAVVRPLIDVRRVAVAAYAAAREVPWVEDPSNRTAVYLRNRIRGDLLPALRRVSPSIETDLLDVARRSARWRHDVEALADDVMRAGGLLLDGGVGLDIPTSAFVLDGEAGLSATTAELLWPALAARIGIVLDRRGRDRLARFTASAKVGRRMPLPGGWLVVRGRTAFAVRRGAGEPRATVEPVALSDDTTFGAWHFRCRMAAEVDAGSAWSAWLPGDATLAVRGWQAGDAMQLRAGGTPHKVKRLLSAAGVTGHERAGWPVVVCGTEIIWVPGVRRAAAATARPGRPGLAFTCEYNRC